MNAKYIILALLLIVFGTEASAQEETEDRIDRLVACSNSLMKTNTFSEALDSTRVLLALVDNGSTPGIRAKAYNNMAICFKELGQYDKADEYYKRSIDLADEKNKDLYRYNYSCFLLLAGGWQKAIECLAAVSSPEYEFLKTINLSSAYFRRGETGDTAKALSLLDEYIATHDAEDVNYPTALQNKGYIYWDTGKTEQAESYLTKALASLPNNRADYYITLANLAMVKGDRDDTDGALKDINEVIGWQEKNIGTAHPDYIISLRKRAEILLKAGKKNDALQAFRDYYNKEKQYIYSEFPNATQDFRLNYWYSQKPLLSKIFQLEDTSPTFLYDVALFRRQMTLLGNNASDVKKATDINADRLKRAMNRNEAAIEFVCYYDEASTDTVYAALLLSPASSAKYVRIADKKDLHGYILPDGTTLENGICSTASKVKGVIYTDSLLARMIWEPICKLLPANTTKVYFAPDGILQMLGIENLPYEGLKNKELHRLTSTVGLLHRSPETISPSAHALVIGGVNYDAASSENGEDDTIEANLLAYNYMKDECGLDPANGLFPYLQGSKAEADSIIFKLPKADDGKDGRCSEEYIKRRLGDYDLVHLSTHGYSLKVNVERIPASQCDSLMADKTLLAAGIALKGANVAGSKGEREDGLLSARELCDIDSLNKINLIVLSACQTAQGVVSDEGPTGIVRGLKKAGANTIVASLWPVNDKATALFMNAFYTALRDKTKYEALRYAQDAVRNYTIKTSPLRFSPKTMSHRLVDDAGTSRTEFKPYADPYYWAPFIMIDDI